MPPPIEKFLRTEDIEKNKKYKFLKLIKFYFLFI